MTAMDKMNLVMLTDLMIKHLEKALDGHESAEDKKAALLKAADGAETLAIALRKYVGEKEKLFDAEETKVVGKNLLVFPNGSGCNKALQSVKQTVTVAEAAVQRIHNGGQEHA